MTTKEERAAHRALQERRYQLWEKRDTAGLTEAEQEELRQVDFDIRDAAERRKGEILAWAGSCDTEEEIEARRCRGEE